MEPYQTVSNGIEAFLDYISEQTAPPDFVCVWEKPFTRTLDRNKGNQFKVTEKLFTYISPLHK